MSLVSLEGDPVLTPHVTPCTTITKCLSPCPNVLVGGIAVHYVTGVTPPHTYLPDDDGCDEIEHTGVLAPNASTVFVYPAGAPVQIARVGDKYSVCGGTISPSPTNITVFAY